MDDSYLTLDEVAKRWKVDRATVYRSIVSGRLPAYNFGTGQRRACWRVRASDLQEYEKKLRSGIPKNHSQELER
jgi:excisionase family DNA binding protein